MCTSARVVTWHTGNTRYPIIYVDSDLWVCYRNYRWWIILFVLYQKTKQKQNRIWWVEKMLAGYVMECVLWKVISWGLSGGRRLSFLLWAVNQNPFLTHSPRCGAAPSCGPGARLAHQEEKKKDIRIMRKIMRRWREERSPIPNYLVCSGRGQLQDWISLVRFKMGWFLM